MTMSSVAAIPAAVWLVLGQMAPYLLFGFLMAGILSVLIGPEWIERHLGRGRFGPVIKAAAFGVPLPLCSCGVIPVAASLRRHGANNGAAAAFLLSTPQTSVDSVLVTYSLLGPIYAIFRPVAALVTGIIGGLLVSVFGEEAPESEEDKDPAEPACTDDCCAPKPGHGKVRRILNYGFRTLPEDIGKPLIIGLIIAGALGALVPNDFFASYFGGGFAAMVLMMLVGIPVYVCATASVPVAAALILKGVSPGTALVFLMTGPATNAAAVATLWKVMGKRSTVTYLATVALSSLGAGLLLDSLVTSAQVKIAAKSCHELLPPWVKTIATVILLAVLAAALLRRNGDHSAHEGHAHEDGDHCDHDGHSMETVELQVSGMTCNHCRKSVERALRECAGVEAVDVDLKGGRATAKGRKLVPSALAEAVEGLGFEVKPLNDCSCSGDCEH